MLNSNNDVMKVLLNTNLLNVDIFILNNNLEVNSSFKAVLMKGRKLKSFSLDQQMLQYKGQRKNHKVAYARVKP